MTRRNSRGQIFYVFWAISVACYLSRVCIIVVYYLPLGTFNLHHFLPRHTMPRQRDLDGTNNIAEFPTVEISTYDGRKLPPYHTYPVYPIPINTPWTVVRPCIVCHWDRRKKFHWGGNKKISRQITLEAGK